MLKSIGESANRQKNPFRKEFEEHGNKIEKDKMIQLFGPIVPSLEIYVKKSSSEWVGGGYIKLIITV